MPINISYICNVLFCSSANSGDVVVQLLLSKFQDLQLAAIVGTHAKIGADGVEGNDPGLP